ncbi:hypothetical protein VIGAN_01263900 [Vigna angularis var. angularis]|uniref:Uncharacterized protein n=1 Tax=Vigna angularis var. angularis TaxID=157739 RepID=A0A0S3R2N1_PHAAN|nr:hypothetical protein VIGAN_01263900 [Vigna angularis var. angularis]
MGQEVGDDHSATHEIPTQGAHGSKVSSNSSHLASPLSNKEEGAQEEMKLTACISRGSSLGVATSGRWSGVLGQLQQHQNPWQLDRKWRGVHVNGAAAHGNLHTDMELSVSSSRVGSIWFKLGFKQRARTTAWLLASSLHTYTNTSRMERTHDSKLRVAVSEENS